MATLSADIERDLSGALIGVLDYLRRATGARGVLSDRLLSGWRPSMNTTFLEEIRRLDPQLERLRAFRDELDRIIARGGK